MCSVLPFKDESEKVRTNNVKKTIVIQHHWEFKKSSISSIPVMKSVLDSRDLEVIVAYDRGETMKDAWLRHPTIKEVFSETSMKISDSNKKSELESESEEVEVDESSEADCETETLLLYPGPESIDVNEFVENELKF